jgi:hypothetical protein
MKKSQAVAHFKTQRSVARALGITQPTVCEWPELIPEWAAWRLRHLTRRKLDFDPAVYDRAAKREPVPYRDLMLHAARMERRRAAASG